MRLEFGHPASWAFGLGLLAAGIAGSVVPGRTAGGELRQVLGFLLVFAPAVYILIDRKRARWEAKHPYVRFVVFSITMLVATVLLGQVAVFAVGGPGRALRAVGFLAGVAGFATAAWMTFLGGAERVWRAFLSRTDTEW